MRRCRNILLITATVFFVTLTSQCTQRGAHKDSPPGPLPGDSLPMTGPVTEKDPLKAVKELYADIAPAAIPKEIAVLLSEVRKARNDKKTMLVHLQLAWLYGHYKNPLPQYSKALQELDEYLSANPEYGGDDLLQYWHRTLKEIGKLSRENKDLKEKMELLKGQVEQLKHLDIEMEKRRQHIK